MAAKALKDMTSAELRNEANGLLAEIVDAFTPNNDDVDETMYSALDIQRFAVFVNRKLNDGVVDVAGADQKLVMKKSLWRRVMLLCLIRQSKVEAVKAKIKDPKLKSVYSAIMVAKVQGAPDASVAITPGRYIATFPVLAAKMMNLLVELMVLKDPKNAQFVAAKRAGLQPKYAFQGSGAVMPLGDVALKAKYVRFIQELESITKKKSIAAGKDSTNASPRTPDETIRMYWDYANANTNVDINERLAVTNIADYNYAENFNS